MTVYRGNGTGGMLTSSASLYFTIAFMESTFVTNRASLINLWTFWIRSCRDFAGPWLGSIWRAEDMVVLAESSFCNKNWIFAAKVIMSGILGSISSARLKQYYYGKTRECCRQLEERTLPRSQRFPVAVLLCRICNMKERLVMVCLDFLRRDSNQSQARSVFYYWFWVV